MSCAPSHCVCTNRVISMHNSETARKFKLCLCNEAHNERREWHDCSGVLLLNALG